METKHTAGPLHIYEGGNFIKIALDGYDEQVEKIHYLGGPFCIASMNVEHPFTYENHAMNMANAVRLCLCWNLHQELLDALKDEIDPLVTNAALVCQKELMARCRCWECRKERIKALIQKAKAGQ